MMGKSYQRKTSRSKRKMQSLREGTVSVETADGQAIAGRLPRDSSGHELNLRRELLRPGRNVVAVVATVGQRGTERGGRNRPEAGRGILRIVTPTADWKRSVFNGLAQVIVQSTQQSGEITLKASSPDLSPNVIRLQSQPTALRPAVQASQPWESRLSGRFTP